MSRINKMILSVLLLAVMLLASACGNNESINSQTTDSTQTTETQATQPTQPSSSAVEQTATEATEVVTEKATENTTEEAAESQKDIILNNEYVTRFEEVNMVTYPSFIFNYPDNWSVVKEECGFSDELVTLENGEGACVTFLHCSSELNGGGSSVNMARVDVSKVAPSQFVPGFVQATDHSSLGEFMVAKLKTTGILDMQTDREYTDVDGDVSYAVLPLSEEGTREGVRKATSGEFTFPYSSTISFTASDTGDDFTPQEQQEVIAILSSFRVEEY